MWAVARTLSGPRGAPDKARATSQIKNHKSRITNHESRMNRSRARAGLLDRGGNLLQLGLVEIERRRW